MAATTTERKIMRLATQGPGGFRNIPVAAATKILGGTIVCRNAAGHAVPGATATGLVALGVADETVDNTDGAAGDLRVEVRKDGAFGFATAGAADAITFDDIGKGAFVVDNQTVGLTDATGTRSGPVKIYDVKDGAVFIEFQD